MNHALVRSLVLLVTTLLMPALGAAQAVSFPGTGVGPIPDRGAAGCGAPSGPPLAVSFAVSGVAFSATDLESIEVDLDMTHTWTGDVAAELVAPNGTSHILVANAGATTPTGCGDSSDLGGLYTFSSGGSGDFWAAAAAAGGADLVALGAYRTSEPGGTATGGTFTDMLAAFAGVPDLNGTWTLNVTDSGGGDTGEVFAAALALIPQSTLPDPIFDDRFEDPSPP